MPPTPPGPATTWHGFYRQSRRHRWRRLSTAADYDSALRALHEATRALPAGDLLVSERDPNPGRRGRR